MRRKVTTTSSFQKGVLDACGRPAKAGANRIAVGLCSDQSDTNPMMWTARLHG